MPPASEKAHQGNGEQVHGLRIVSPRFGSRGQNHDVWLGFELVVMPGVWIGNGAVTGAGIDALERVV